MRITTGLAGMAACICVATAAAARDLPESGALICPDRGAVPCIFFDLEQGFQLQIPVDWPVRRMDVLTETGPAANARETGATRWLSFNYLPEDPSYPQVALLTLAVFDRSDWYQRALEGEPPGLEVAATASHTAVAAVPRANPYPLESRDAEIFSALVPSFEEASLILTASEP
jgi:hypothetical protein